MSETAFPLCWPSGWKRSKFRKRADFGKHPTKYDSQGQSFQGSRQRLSVNEGARRVLDSLKRMGVGDWNVIISTNVKVRLDGLPYSNQPEPSDTGVAIYWTDSKKNKKCMAVDRYDRVADNLAAIAATLEAMRAIERHGGAEILERAFLGFQSLPPPMEGQKPWWEVLGFQNNESVTLEKAEHAFRELSKKYHPDLGGDHEKFTQLSEAIRTARQTL